MDPLAEGTIVQLTDWVRARLCLRESLRQMRKYTDNVPGRFWT